MYHIIGKGGIEIGRDVPEDCMVNSEKQALSMVVRLLNFRKPSRPWRKFDPSKHGLTDSKIGVRNVKTGEVYWHERYQIESADEAFNAGKLFLLRA